LVEARSEGRQRRVALCAEAAAGVNPVVLRQLLQHRAKGHPAPQHPLVDRRLAATVETAATAAASLWSARACCPALRFSRARPRASAFSSDTQEGGTSGALLPRPFSLARPPRRRSNVTESSSLLLLSSSWDSSLLLKEFKADAVSSELPAFGKAAALLR
jgi:hypothetical protein